MSGVRELLLSRNQPLKSADDSCVRVLKNKMKKRKLWVFEMKLEEKKFDVAISIR